MTVERISDALTCPVCGASITKSEDKRSLVCAGGARGNRACRRHCFDFSASGYVNLAPPSHSLSGDSREAVRSRTRFLDAGYYAPIRDAVCETIKKYCPGGLVVDAGCGEGYYTAAMAGCAEAVIGFDLSKFGIDAAAKRARREELENALFAVSGIYAMPLRDGCADAVVSLFAPCAEQDFSRILRPRGIVIAVGAGENHLLGLKNAVYSEVYKNTPREDMPKSMKLLEENRVSFSISLSDSGMIRDLFSMTPYYYRTSEEDLAKLASLTHLDTEVDITLAVYQKN